ncbi:hypothetical protein nbrc107696_37720 [Gordonia spumicola]|uniref:Uncharacterized protein n=1 Tax=Gordonia spumicola TaxID=589161 RepID=A0A7I9VD92_9ACTN|nr:hypothetical protein [Gordonia spumicola]GEE03326.1 hypothetical protein nbrc107696_37720 [Gordonia spumicola]
MLIAAVALTLVGFGLLVFALITANFALAIACIVVCVIGLAVLLVDTLRANKRRGSGVADEPLFTIRGGESRSKPLDDDADELVDDEVDRAEDVAPSWESEPVAQTPGRGLGSIVSPDAHGSPVDDAPRFVSGRQPQYDSGSQPAAPFGEPSYEQPRYDTGAQPRYDTGSQPRYDTGSQPRYDTGSQPRYVGGPQYDTGQQPVQAETGDANDYIRSVTGQFPAATPTGRIPVTPSYEANPQPAPAADPITGGQPQINTDSGYVGRRRRVEGESDGVVVNTHDPNLPEMKLVYGDETESTDPRAGG